MTPSASYASYDSGMSSPGFTGSASASASGVSTPRTRSSSAGVVGPDGQFVPVEGGVGGPGEGEEEEEDVEEELGK